MALAAVTGRYTAGQIKTYYDAGYWRAQTMSDVLEQRAADRPDKVFLTDSTTSYTFRELRDAALRLAAGLAGRGIGYVRVTGRLKDIVIRGGLNISVRQVEDLLAAHPAVAAVAVVGMPDPVLGERLCCYLLPAAGAAPLTLGQLKDYLTGAGLAIQKVPERIEVVTELPMTATGKIQKHVLRSDITRKLSAG